MPVPRGYKPGSEIGSFPVTSICPVTTRAAACWRLGLSAYASRYVDNFGKLVNKYGFPKLIEMMGIFELIKVDNALAPLSGRPTLRISPERTRPYNDAIIRSDCCARSTAF